MTKLPSFRPFTGMMPNITPSTVPKPPAAPTAADVAAFIVRAGEWRRGEASAPGGYEDQNESGQEKLEPGDLILNAIKRQQEGK
jgi:hypothetical protein